MSSTDSYYIQILNSTIVYLYQYIAPILYIMGNIGNLLGTLVFFKRSWRKNVCAFYFLVCLFFNSCYINTSILTSIITAGFNINAYNSNRAFCKLFYYTSYVFTRLLSTILILASIDRLLISSQNVDTRLYSSKRLAYFSVSIGVSIWVIFYIHALIKVDIYQIYPGVFACYYDTSGFYFVFVSYSSLVINITSFVALFILSILTFKNVRRIRTIPRQQRRQLRSMNKKDFQLLRCLYVHDVVYIIFSIFSSVFAVYLATRTSPKGGSLQVAIETFLGQSFTFIHHISFCASFFIFISISKGFRREIKRMAYKMCGKNLTVVREEEENKQKKNVKENVELSVIDAVETIELPA